VLQHHIQKSIVYKLAFSNGLRFSELKPDDLENKLFDYHLKIVIRDGYVEKTEDGLYKLTAEGRRIGKRASEKQLTIADRAESILLLIVRKQLEGDWLLYKRATHPLIGKVGFIHANPVVGQSVTEIAHDQCLERTGLDCTFKPLGSGYITTYDKETLESYINFTLLVADSAKGELQQNDENAEYFWQSEPDFSDPDMIPTTAYLADLYSKGDIFFTEKTLRY